MRVFFVTNISATPWVHGIWRISIPNGPMGRMRIIRKSCSRGIGIWPRACLSVICRYPLHHHASKDAYSPGVSAFGLNASAMQVPVEYIDLHWPNQGLGGNKWGPSRKQPCVVLQYPGVDTRPVGYGRIFESYLLRILKGWSLCTHALSEPASLSYLHRFRFDITSILAIFFSKPNLGPFVFVFRAHG